MTERRRITRGMGEAAPMHLTDNRSAGLTLCGADLHGLVTMPARLARADHAGPRCELCYRIAGLFRAVDGTGRRRRRPSVGQGQLWADQDR